MREFILKDQKKLRTGFTTGTCAAAAAYAAAARLLLGADTGSAPVRLPGGELVSLPVFPGENDRDGTSASCYAVKDGGDDPDVTTGSKISVSVEELRDRRPEARWFRGGSSGSLFLAGGEGVGTVVTAGLEQEPGQAAINRVPRQMIFDAVEAVRVEAEYGGPLLITVSVPDGRALAAKTFNPSLGIEGGISILGTSGIVEPMSRRAVLDTIGLQLERLRKLGESSVLVTPGRYGRRYAEELLGLGTDRAAECSNYIGETLDLAVGLEFDGFLLVGNFGKLVKMAAGIMDTHSRVADGRREIIAARAAVRGADRDTVLRVMNCFTTDEMLLCLEDGLRDRVVEDIAAEIARHAERRTGGKMRFGAVMVSERFGLLAKAGRAEELIREFRKR